MRLAVVGKGGAGKTTMSGTLARLLARRGRRVLAVDFDTCPGLSGTLGMPPCDGGLPDEAVEADATMPYGWRLASGLGAAEAVERFSTPAPDGVHYLSPGKTHVDNVGVKRCTKAVLQIVEGFSDPGWDVVGDMSAGTTAPYEKYHRYADRIALVVTPAWSSYVTAVRLRPLLDPLPVVVVASRFDGRPDHPEMVPDLRLPFDRAVIEADRLGVALIDYAPESPVVAALDTLVGRLIGVEVPV